MSFPSARRSAQAIRAGASQQVAAIFERCGKAIDRPTENRRTTPEPPGVLRRSWRDTRGAAAVEFALMASILILTTLFIMTVGLIIYMNQALDYATAKAARQIMTGAAQSASMSQTTFQALVCSYLPSAMSCPNVIVNLYLVRQSAASATSPSQYYNYVTTNATSLIIPTLSNASASYQVGAQGDYQYLQAVYPITFIPSAFAQMLGSGATFNGQPAYLVFSTAAFRNEQY